jgi:hypothetical protein
MPFFPIFLTVVFVGRNSSSSLEQALQRAISTVSGIVADTGRRQTQRATALRLRLRTG